MSKVKMQIRDIDLAQAETALRRAANRAKKIAEETHTPLVVYEGERVLKKFPGKKRANKSKLPGIS
jgi:hypothetical protein